MNSPNQKSSHRLLDRFLRGVTMQLFLVVVLPLTVLVLIVTFGSLKLHYESMRSLVADRNLRTVEFAADNLDNEISRRGLTLEMISRNLTPKEQTDDYFTQIEKDLSIFDGGAALISSDGENITFIKDNTAIRDLAASPAWRTIQSIISNSSFGKVEYLPIQKINEKLFVPVLVSSSSKTGLIGLFSPEVMLSDGLAIFSKEKQVTVLVIDNQYQILYQDGKLDSEENLSTHPGIQNALSGLSGINYLQTDQGEHVISSSPIQSVNWALMIEESWEDIASPLLRVTQNAPLIAIPILGLSLIALWFGLSKIVQPMQALGKKASDLAQGNFESIRQPVGGVFEIRHLQETLIKMAQQVKEAQKSQHSYIGAITESVEGERRNLARELHDETIQSLIVLGQYTQFALLWNKDPKVEKSLNQVINMIDETMKDLRRLIQGLRPIYIEDLGLATALGMLATKNEDEDDVKIHFQQPSTERRLKPDVEMALYRIAQESLTNVIRHARARNAWISLYFHTDGVALEIRDDGVGFNLPSNPIHYASKGHYGLLGLYERCELIGAKLTIQSSQEGGTRILVRLSDHPNMHERQ